MRQWFANPKYVMPATQTTAGARNRLSTLARYFHTARHLRPGQVAARVWFKLHRPRPDIRAAPPQRLARGSYVTPVEPSPSLLGPERFRFLNVERQCAEAADWHPGEASRLWVYNLHYFDDLNARDSASRQAWHRRLLERWVAENPPGHGDAWDPYPVSRRIVSWVKWSLRGNELPPPCRTSLAVQARWLSARLEYHLQGNHLFANAKALVHAGAYFEGPEAEQWLARGLSIIAHELPEQVLPDGGHFERSPMYHASALEDLLDLVNLLRAYGRTPPAAWLAAIAGMRRWLEVMTHPDGQIAFFNDAAFDIAPHPRELEAFAARLGLGSLQPVPGPVTVLDPSGYVRAIAGPAFIIGDCAAVGPDHLPAHAHADTLSFELSLWGRRVFVNSGTSQYGSDSERQRQRGTGAHNTVTIDGADSSEVWSGFRVARRARARLSAAHASTQGILITGSHDGYRRLPGRNEHRRTWRLDEDGLNIEDLVSGEFRSAEARFHLHPEVAAAALDERREVNLTLAQGNVVRMAFDGAESVEVISTHWHPQFGVRQTNACVVARFSGGRLATRVSWGRSP